jgi:Dolichyl-phosphate-mannose-protein mannosyltransferase
MVEVIASRDVRARHGESKRPLYFICLLYLMMSVIFGSLNFDIDEFGFVREPYEIIGGDYTLTYLRQHNYAEAAKTLINSYYFYWKYRPLFSPIISAKDKTLFAAQELEFGYTKPTSVSKEAQDSLTKYKKRLIVPEPDRFYSHGAGKPLLAAIVSMPQLALIRVVTTDAKNLLYYQYHYNYHPIFVLSRLVQILSGLATILIVYWILISDCDRRTALFGAAITACFPTCIKFFPNLHQDSIQIPFLLLSVYFFYKEQYKRAGVCFGLALAVKNVAIILVPVFLAYAVTKAWQARRTTATSQDKQRFPRALTGFATTMLLSTVVLLPFADPISYAEEVLTPITHREYDLRGENVEQFTLSEKLTAPSKGESSSGVRSEVLLSQLLLRLGDNNFFFLVIAVLLFWLHCRNPLARIAFIVVLFALPYGVVFGSGLNYRSLLFVPFFAIVCAILAPKRYLMCFVGLLLVVDVIYCFDPITTDNSHNSVSNETFWAALSSSMAAAP